MIKYNKIIELAHLLYGKIFALFKIILNLQ
jgi:hypothetical protein